LSSLAEAPAAARRGRAALFAVPVLLVAGIGGLAVYLEVGRDPEPVLEPPAPPPSRRGPSDADLPEWLRPVAGDARELGQIDVLEGCAAGFSDGCFAEGRFVFLLALRMDGMRDLPRAADRAAALGRVARAVMNEGCAHEHAASCGHLGELAYQGIGAPADVQEALRLYRLACDDGYAPSCRGVAELEPRVEAP
jgi:hypothetical protein